MIVSRKISQIEVFAGSPWEVASAKSLLKAASIEVAMKDKGIGSILLSVPCEYYTAAMRVIGQLHKWFVRLGLIRKVKPECIVLHSGFFLIDSTYIPLVPLLFSQKNDASYR